MIIAHDVISIDVDQENVAIDEPRANEEGDSKSQEENQIASNLFL